MTPFGERIRELRRARGMSLKEMAALLEVSPAYLSALEHGRRGRPGPGLVMQIAGLFDLIWDDAERLKRLAHLSHPRVPINTAGLDRRRTLLANLLAERIAHLPPDRIEDMIALLDQDTSE